MNRAPVQFFETLKGKNGKWKLRHSESFRPLSPALLARTPGFSYAAVAATAVAATAVAETAVAETAVAVSHVTRSSRKTPTKQTRR